MLLLVPSIYRAGLNPHFCHNVRIRYLQSTLPTVLSEIYGRYKKQLTMVARVLLKVPTKKDNKGDNSPLPPCTKHQTFYSLEHPVCDRSVHRQHQYTFDSKPQAGDTLPDDLPSYTQKGIICWLSRIALRFIGSTNLLSCRNVRNRDSKYLSKHSCNSAQKQLSCCRERR